MSGIKTRPAGEVGGARQSIAGVEVETRTAAALRNFHFAGIVSARAPPSEMEAEVEQADTDGGLSTLFNFQSTGN